MAPAARRLWDERATGAVLEFLEGSVTGCRTSARAVTGPQRQEREREGEDQGSEGPGPTLSHIFLCCFLC